MTDPTRALTEEELIWPDDHEVVKNGQVWRHPVTCHRCIVQWIDDDDWVLMSVPYYARYAGTAMCTHHEASGKRVYTRKELERRLIDEGWERLPTMAVALIEKQEAELRAKYG